MITIEETIEAIHNSHGGLTDEEIRVCLLMVQEQVLLWRD